MQCRPSHEKWCATRRSMLCCVVSRFSLTDERIAATAPLLPEPDLMGVLSAVALTVLLTPGASPGPDAATRPGRPLPGGELSAEDARFLDHLIEWFLFDPAHATRV